MSKVKPAEVRQTREDLIRGLAEGRLRFHELPKELSADERAAIRREALQSVSGQELEHIGSYTFDARSVSRRNCENLIGVAQIPMGVVGPLTIRGQELDGDVFVPLATTEGALVASTNRGCSAIRAAGGARVFIEDVGMSRAPVFRTSGLEQTREFLEWIRGHEDALNKIARSTSSFLELTDVRPHVFGTSIFLRFRFRSGDAMGMNMATIACDRMIRELIEPETGVPCVALSGNYCVDKKPAAINFQEGRGKRLFAEVVLEAPVLRDVLKTNSRTLVEVQYRKNQLGSMAAGALGYNAHFANILAAFFVATGQDLAHVVGGSMGVTCIEPRGPEAVYASVYLPDVPLGAIGGGTHVATQAEALAMMGVAVDPERPGAAVMRLAEILAGAVLAGELSLMASFTSNDLARAHERLGRCNGNVDEEPAGSDEDDQGPGGRVSRLRP